MSDEHQNSDEKAPDAAGQMMDWTGSKYRKFMDYVAFRDDDPTWMLGYKLFIRLIGVLIMIALSPFLILGLTLAFIAVF